LYKIFIFLFLITHLTLNAIDLTKEEKDYLSKKKIIKVTNLTTFPPFNFNENNEPVGYTIDYINLMKKYLDIEIEFVTNKSFKEHLRMLREGSIDIIPHLAVNNDRKDYVEFTSFNHIEYTTGFVVRNNEKIKTLLDLKDKKIAITNKSFLHTQLRKKYPDLIFYLTESTSKSLDAVSSGKADVAIGSLPSLEYFIQENWISNVKIVKIEGIDIPLSMQLPMAVAKNNFLLKSILEKINKTIPHNEVVKLKTNWMQIDSVNNNLTLEEKNYLKRKKKILMCSLPNTLPFEKIDQNGKHKGISEDIIQIVSTYISTPIELLPTKTWTESLDNINNRKCDILPIAMDLPHRRYTMNFTRPYLSEPFVIVTKLDKLFIKDSTALQNKKIGTVKNYAFSAVLKSKNPSIELVEVKSSQEGLERVASGELFGYIDTMPVVGYMMQKYSLIDLKIAGKLEFNINLSVASRNDEPLLNSVIQKALDTISEDRKRTIVGEWISIKVAQETNYTVLLQITGAFLLILLVILYKNKAVQKINKQLINANKSIKEQQNMVNKYVLILTTDLTGIITDVNEAYCKAVGFTPNDMIGSSHIIMKHPDMKKEVFKQMWIDIELNKIWNGEIQNLTKNGDTIWFFVNIEPIFKDNKKIGYRSISENITNKKKIEKLSITDQLTQLYNRHKLEDSFVIEIERAKRYKHSLSMIILDIDYFKSVNDEYGHDIGDTTLKSVASLLKNSIRLTDIVGRWGGEEFIIIVPETNLEQAMQLAEKIRLEIQSYSFEEIGHKTASFGVSTYMFLDTKEQLIKRADEALYKAKENGRNRVEVN